MSMSRVSEIMSGNVIDIHESESIAAVIQLYTQHKISGVPVRNESGDYVAVISKTDLVTPKLVKLLSENRTLETIQVKELMSGKPPISLREDQPIDDAIEMMLSNKVHRLFVNNKDGQMVGVVSTFDIVRFTRFTFESYI